jgi:hypothetical protein
MNIATTICLEPRNGNDRDPLLGDFILGSGRDNRMISVNPVRQGTLTMLFSEQLKDPTFRFVVGR